MSTESLIARANAADTEIVETVGEYQFTRAELSAYFARVQNPKNWKLPVDAQATFASPRERIAMHVAVLFFTGSAPTLEFISTTGTESTYRVRAAGYYAAVGA